MLAPFQATSEKAMQDDNCVELRRPYVLEFDVELCFYVVGLTTLLAFTLIAVPLGFHGEMNDVAFSLSQLVYCWLAFNLTRYMFEFSTPGISLKLHCGIFMSATLCVCLMYVLYFQDVREDGNLGTGILRILPSTTFVAFVIGGYFVHALQVEYPEVPDDDIKTISPYVSHLDIKWCELEGNCSVDRKIYDYTWLEFFGIVPHLKELNGVVVKGPVIVQWAKSVLMLLSVTFVYLYCQFLALFFSHAKNRYGEVSIYILFTASFLALKPILRKIGRVTDQNKSGGPSLELLMEMSAYFFYFTFERNLFISVNSYASFFAIKAFYVLFELLDHTITFNVWYHRTLTRLFQMYKFSPFPLQILKIFSGGVHADLSLQVQCLRTGMRVYCLLTTAITFLCFFLFLRFGYNKNFYCLYAEISDSDFATLMNITALSVLIEALLFLFADVLYFYNFFHRGILVTWQHLLRGKLGLPHASVVMYSVWLMTHVTTDLYIARIDVSRIGGIDCPDIE